MRLVLLREIPEDEILRRQWNRLVERVAQPQVFYTYEWALAVQRAYRSSMRPLLFLGYDEQGALTGVAALATNCSGEHVSFLCSSTGDYCDFLAPLEAKVVFIGEVLAALRQQGVRDMALTNLPADSTTVAAIRQAAGNHAYRYFARTAYVCTQVSLSSLDRANGEKPEMPRPKMVRRFIKAMSREGPVRLDHARTWDVAEPILPEFMRAHVGRFLFTGRISNIARPERRVFLAELAKLLSQSGWLALTRMISGENAFAWNYGFRFHGTWFWYQPTFDSTMEKYSPGFCLLAKLIEEVAADPSIDAVDMGLGAEEYKDRFANQTRETLYVTLHTSGSDHYLEMVRYRAAEVVKLSPLVEKCARALVTRVASLGRRLREHGPRATLAWGAGRMRVAAAANDEVFFYDWNGAAPRTPSGLEVRALGLDELADAAMEYGKDEAALQYLLRSAARLRTGTAQGFVLVGAAGKPMHFAWASPFAGFFMSELNTRLSSPGPGSIMLFDCWTPPAQRGNGYYGVAVEILADRMMKEQKRPWIFSAATSLSSVKGLAKTGFRRRYSLFRKKLLFWQRVTGQPPNSSEIPVAEVSAQ